MPETKKIIRLSKVAREFNIGISTIVDFLSKKGHTIESNPNTKISQDLYELIVDEYQTDKSVKEESKKIGLRTEKKKSLSIDDPDAQNEEIDEDEEEEESQEEELIIKNEQLADTETKVEKTKVPKVETKVLGKIDLEEDKKKSRKIEQEDKDNKEPEKEEKKEEEKKTVENETKSEKTKKEPDLEEKESKEEKEKEEKDSVKVLGKIDLDSMNQKTKPDRKIKPSKIKQKEETKKENKPADKKDKEKEAKIESKEKSKDKKTEKPEKETAEPIKKQEESKKQEEGDADKESFLKTKYQKLNGPTIVGKMKLDDSMTKKKEKEKEKEKKKARGKGQSQKKADEKKPVASSSDDNKPKKRKRKRIKKDGRPVNVNQQDKQKRDHKKRPSRKTKERHEPSEEEVQKQIKETLARLSGGGKSKASKYRRKKRDQINQNIKEEQEKQEKEQTLLKVTEFVSANELANLMDVQVTEVISKCMELGMFVSINQRLDAETITIVADEFGFEIEFISAEDQEKVEEEEEENEEDMTPRAPIVTVMGHVDHGKTKLLDYIRKANIIAGEAGGITQHIGAYEVTLENEKKITFLDTPGHEAFTAMRARGAKVTDIVIIIVAADDSVMPQTVEAINHAKAAGVPIVIAINKIDKPAANPEKVREELSKINILVEDWGGKYQCQEISAKNGINIDELLEKVLLEAEMLDLKANATKPAKGTIIESSLDRGRGYVAKLLVQSGVMKVGDMILAGCHYGRVKAMYNERNQEIEEAGPSQPLLLLGLNGAPQAGDTFNVMEDEQEAKNVATKRLQIQREQGIRTQKHITLDEIGRRIAIGDFQELNVIIKGDVDGSIEALSDSMLKLSTDEVQVNVISKSVGQVTETDVNLAIASNAIIIGFQVRPSVSARKLAEKEQIDIRTYSVIYAAINELKSAIEGMLRPDIEENILCNLEVREAFKISKVGTIAGCMVLDGKISRKTKIRVIRDGIVIYTGLLGSLKRFKDDVKEVNAGYECGLNIESFNDIKVGDIIEGYEEVEVKRTLQ